MNTLVKMIFCAVALVVASSAGTSVAQEVKLRFEDYEARLNAILKTRRDEERDFVQQVVAKIRAGEIPERLVETSYKWVLNKRPDTNYPFVYFERVLRLQAKKVELDRIIPVFDYSVYKRPAKWR